MDKILIVDDEDMIRVNLEAFLEDEGYSVVCASTGEEALEILRHPNDIKVAIVDIRLPGIDGNTMMQQGKQLSAGLDFIIHTGSSEYELPDMLKSQGLSEQDILYKPLVEMDELLRMIKARLSGSSH